LVDQLGALDALGCDALLGKDVGELPLLLGRELVALEGGRQAVIDIDTDALSHWFAVVRDAAYLVAIELEGVLFGQARRRSLHIDGERVHVIERRGPGDVANDRNRL